MKFTYHPQGVCSQVIEFEIDNEGVLRNVAFTRGCHGNTQGICALAEGRHARDVSECLKGIRCKDRPTSCPDQLARALSEALEKMG